MAVHFADLQEGVVDEHDPNLPKTVGVLLQHGARRRARKASSCLWASGASVKAIVEPAAGAWMGVERSVEACGAARP